MKLVKLIEFLRDRLKTVMLGCIAVLVLLVLADILFVDKDEAHTGRLSTSRPSGPYSASSAAC